MKDKLYEVEGNICFLLMKPNVNEIDRNEFIENLMELRYYKEGVKIEYFLKLLKHYDIVTNKTINKRIERWVKESCKRKLVFSNEKYKIYETGRIETITESIDFKPKSPPKTQDIGKSNKSYEDLKIVDYWDRKKGCSVVKLVPNV